MAEAVAMSLKVNFLCLLVLLAAILTPTLCDPEPNGNLLWNKVLLRISVLIFFSWKRCSPRHHCSQTVNIIIWLFLYIYYYKWTLSLGRKNVSLDLWVECWEEYLDNVLYEFGDLFGWIEICITLTTKY